MRFVGRERELAALDGLYGEDSFQMLVIYVMYFEPFSIVPRSFAMATSSGFSCSRRAASWPSAVRRQRQWAASL